MPNKKIHLAIAGLLAISLVLGAFYFFSHNSDKLLGNIKQTKLSPEEQRKQAELVQAETVKKQNEDYVKLRQIEAEKKAEGCKALGNNDLIDDCYYKLANEFQREEDCDRISSSSVKIRCHDLFAYIKAQQGVDPQKCLALVNEFKDPCLDGFFLSFVTSDKCDQFEPAIRTRCMNIFKSREAYSKGDSTLCSSVSDKTLRANCQSQTAAKPKDTDGDGISDSQERAYGTTPFDKDTDQDGLSDYEEIFTYHTNARKLDTDGDGHSDGDEVKNSFNPCGNGKLPTGQDLVDGCRKYLKR
ncbi:hypothetical protein HGA64_03510 [Candidatus Falkowbacteria bacterium]|nr:hypothetical protein [Candidatus Falkowbacteria bacterium]